MTLNEFLTDIANALREQLPIDTKIDARDFVAKIHDACSENYGEGYQSGQIEGYESGHVEGYENGRSAGYSDGYDFGKMEVYHNFWDTYQDNGQRTHYAYAFGGYGWTDETFKPKYDIIVGNNASPCIFAYSQLTNLKKILNEQNVRLDTSICTDLGSMFNGCTNLTSIPPIDASNSKHCNSLFLYCGKIDGIYLKLKNDGTQTFTNAFFNCNELRDLTITGVIGENISLKQSKYLSQGSLLSILKALSTTTTGKTLTLSDNISYLTSFADVKQAIKERPNWTISFVRGD